MNPARILRLFRAGLNTVEIAEYLAGSKDAEPEVVTLLHQARAEERGRLAAHREAKRGVINLKLAERREARAKERRRLRELAEVQAWLARSQAERRA